MKIYNFHPITQEFLSESLADKSPLEPDVFLIPANATSIVPPNTSAHEVAVFNSEKWSVLNDYRGLVYYKNDGSKVEINEIGVDPEDDDEYLGLEPPPKPISEVKTDKLAEIRVAYDAAAIAPVSALDKRWDGGFESAIKLDAAMRLSQAAGAEGVVFYDFDNIAHALSFADALQVCIAVASAYQTALSKKQSLFVAVEAVQVSEIVTEVQAIEAVQAIVW